MRSGELEGLPIRARAERVAWVGTLVRPDLVVGLTALLAVGGLALANGGYFPPSWGWSGLGLLWVAALALAFGATARLGRLELVFLGSIAGLSFWTFLSLSWTASITATLFEGQRSLVYVSAALVGLMVAARGSQRALIVGVWGAATLVSMYGLATRLFPSRFGSFDPIAGYRLSDPLGYWNAFGLLAAMGVLLALALAARSGTVLRSLAGASTVMLLPTLYFTFGRGAWVAMLGGLVAAIAIDRRRLQLVTTGLAIAPWAAVGVWLASRSDALTHQTTSLGAAEKDGHGLAVILILLATGAALTMLAFDAIESRFSVRPQVRRAYAGTLLFVLAAVVIGVVGRYGGPSSLADKAVNAFRAAPPQTHGDLNSRLFNLSGNGRPSEWRVAWKQYTAHPLLGSGSGTYDEYWFRERPSTFTVHDAHNLYLETLAELGPIGLALLVAALVVPLVAAVRGPRTGLATAAFGAYVAFLLHAAVDWDWEMPALTVSAIFLGAALLRQPGRAVATVRPGIRLRVGGVAAMVVLGGFVVVGLLGNSAVSASSTAAGAGNYREAASEAHSAMTWAPWSSQPWRRLGEAQLGLGEVAAARASFRKAVAKDSRDWTLWLELAVASSGRAQQQAIAAASRLNPMAPEIVAFRSSLQQQKGSGSAAS